MTFKVGEICIVVGAQFHPENIGLEVEIVAGPDIFRTRQGCFYGYHWLHPVTRKGFVCDPWQLRRKNPPPVEPQQVGEWDLCPWQPECSTAGKAVQHD